MPLPLLQSDEERQYGDHHKGDACPVEIVGTQEKDYDSNERCREKEPNYLGYEEYYGNSDYQKNHDAQQRQPIHLSPSDLLLL